MTALVKFENDAVAEHAARSRAWLLSEDQCLSGDGHTVELCVSFASWHDTCHDAWVGLDDEPCTLHRPGSCEHSHHHSQDAESPHGAPYRFEPGAP